MFIDFFQNGGVLCMGKSHFIWKNKLKIFLMELETGFCL